MCVVEQISSVRARFCLGFLCSVDVDGSGGGTCGAGGLCFSEDSLLGF